MSKTTLAFGSFVVGLSLGSLFLGSQTVTVAQAPPSGAPPPRGVIVTGSEPTVPPINQVLKGATLTGVTQHLDGFEFDDSTFNNVTLEYAGGSYTFKNTKFSLPIRLQLRGAAANTVGLIAVVEALNKGAAPKPLPPNSPVLKAAESNHVMTVSFTSPYGLK